MSVPITATRNAVAVSFMLNGVAMASLFSRVPQVRDGLGLSNTSLGLLLLCLSGASVLSLPTAGGLIHRFGAARVVRAGTVLVLLGVPTLAIGVAVGAVVPVALALVAYGVGTSVWDVSMNVEGAAVERELERTIMPRFHAAFSLGTVAGALLGAATLRLAVPITVHLGLIAALVAAGSLWSTTRFLPAEPAEEGAGAALAAWREPRTLAIGLMVLAFALTEGSANDWLALALKDGHAAEEWLAVLGFAAFVSAMTVGRVAGTVLLDRYGRVPVLYATAAAALGGLLLVVFATSAVLVTLGILLWGLGASLGFPVGMSAAADDPVRAAARVSVVSTIGYCAFLTGPPLLGFVGDQIGTLRSLLVVAAFLVPSMLVVRAARPR